MTNRDSDFDDDERPPSDPAKLVAYYRRKSADCQRRAEEAHDDETRDQWLRLANDWALLADQSGRGRL